MMEWMISSSVMILAFALLRRIMKERISMRLQYALWGIVLLRLLIPWNPVDSEISVLNVTKEPRIQSVVESVQEPIRFESDGFVADEESGETRPVTNTYYIADSKDINHFYSTAEIAYGVWGIGCVVILGFMLLSNLHFMWKLTRSREPVDMEEIELPVYVTEQVETPCLAGFFRPAIYLTTQSMELENRYHVLEHEMTHYQQKDHIISLLRCIALALHWYNPLVWWAAKVSKEDAELSCDEGTIARLGEGERLSYGKTLLEMTCTSGKTHILLTATTMTDGKRSLKQRIQLIVQKPKLAAFAVIVVLLVMAIVVGCTFTGAREVSQMARLSNGELIQLLQEETDSEKIGQILAALAEKTDLHRGESWIREYDAQHSGVGYQLNSDQLEPLLEAFSGYTWTRLPEEELLTEDQIRLELELEYTDGEPIHILMQSNLRLSLRDRLQVCWYSENGEGMKRCVFRAEPKEGTKLVICGILRQLFDDCAAKADDTPEETSVRAETEGPYFPPLLEQTEESKEIIQMISDMIALTKDTGEGSVRLLDGEEAYTLELEDAQLDLQLAENWRYGIVWLIENRSASKTLADFLG